ncbi:MAG: TetR/AcrR family transcriptional regulator [Steroidobacteraceae bacterium]
MLDVAQCAFLDLGYAEATLDRIARDAGVAKKTLYEHFGDKEGLFAAVLQRLRQVWIAGLQDVVTESADLRAALQGAARHLLDVGTRPDMVGLHRLLLLEARRFPKLINASYDKRGARVDMGPLSNYLRSAANDGLLQFDDVDLATEQFVHLVLGGIRMRMLRGVSPTPDAETRARIARQAVRIFLHGCRSPTIADSRRHR